jgi:hypothetical protein
MRQGRWGAAPWPVAWAAPSHSKGPHLANRQLLHDLDVERNLFCPLTVAEMDGGRLATRRRLRQSSTAVGASSGGAPALGSAPVVEMMSGDSPPSSGSAREALEYRGGGTLVGSAVTVGKSDRGGTWVLLFVGQGVQHERNNVPDISSNRIEDS